MPQPSNVAGAIGRCPVPIPIALNSNNPARQTCHKGSVKLPPPIQPTNNSSNQSKRQLKPAKSKQNVNEATTTNLARQILNNLNIFSNKPGSSSQSTAQMHQQQHHHHQQQQHLQQTQQQQRHQYHHHEYQFPTPNHYDHSMQSHHHRSSSHRSRSRTRADSYLDPETSSLKSTRRPSVDTVSTYLSHESKESSRSRNIGSVSDLLDCSIGSDEVFSNSSPVPPPPPPPPPIPSGQMAGSIVGVDPASDMISRFVRVVDPPKWPNAQPCPMCMDELCHNSQNPAISLSRCQHLMHLQCLNELIICQQKQESYKSLYIECPVCGIVYGEKIGNQPAGAMTWIIIPKCLPGHEGQNTIQIVYK